MLTLTINLKSMTSSGNLGLSTGLLSGRPDEGKNFKAELMRTMSKTDVTHWNQAMNKGASRVLPSLCPLSKLLFTKTRDIETDLRCFFNYKNYSIIDLNVIWADSPV